MYGLNSSQFASAVFLWPAFIAESASELASAAAREVVSLAIAPQPQTSAREPQWVTQNRVALELVTVRLRDFSTSVEGLPVLICAPFALHASSITDFAPSHSLVAALQGAGVRRVFVTDWRSASPDMRFLLIDNYLADLNVVVDELGGRVNLLGLCQGGWMALVYAARFPRKVGKLVLAGRADRYRRRQFQPFGAGAQNSDRYFPPACRSWPRLHPRAARSAVLGSEFSRARSDSRIIAVA